MICAGNLLLRPTVRNLVLAFLVTIPAPLAAQDAKQQAPEEETSADAFDPDAFLRDNLVIDATTSYYSPEGGINIGQPNFDKDDLGRSVKEATGIDIAGITVSRPESFQRERLNFEQGKYQGAMLIRTAADMDTAVREKKYGVLLYVQKHHPLNGSAANVARWYDQGLRILQLQYSKSDPNQSPEEQLGGGHSQDIGLTPLGRAVVHECIRLGIVIDLSHCSERTTIETAEIAKQFGVPITANHVGARNVKDKDGKYLARYSRNATDKKMLAVKETGGVVGVMAYGPYLRGPYQELRMTGPPPDIQPATVDDFVTHIDYIVKLIGVDHVGICTDGYLDGTMAYGRKADGLLDSPRRWHEVVLRLHQKGYSDEDIKKIVGLNLLRVYRKVLK